MSRNGDVPDKNDGLLILVPTLFNPLFDKKAMQVQQLTFPHKSIGLSANTGFDTVDYNIEDRDAKIIALIKGKEQYVFIYNENNRAETLRLLARYASNPELSFTWYDAAVLSQKIRQEGLKQTRDKQRTEAQCDISQPVDEWI